MRRTNRDYSSYSKYEEMPIESEPLENVATDEPVKEEIENIELPKKEEKPDKETKGKVANTASVCVRTQPNSTCPVAAIALLDEEVSVFQNKSTSDFYAVKTSVGVDGYIKKDYLKLI